MPPASHDYRGRTLDWLICANAARKTPFPDRDLCAYNNHTHASVRVRKTFLRRAGALNKDNTLNWTSDLVQNLSPPLEELQALPALRSRFNQKVVQNLSEKSGLGHEEAADQLSEMTVERAIQLLTSWVDSGSAGRDTPKFIDQIMALRDRVSGGVGPPKPAGRPETISRLVALFDSLSDDTLIPEACGVLHDLRTARTAAQTPPEDSSRPPDQGPSPSGPSGPLPTDDLPQPDSRGPSGDSPS